MPARQLFIHQHADGDGQRLGADVARHIQNEGLEADDQRDLRNDGLEQPDDGGNAHAEKEQDNQPRQALFEAGFQRLVQILLAGQAAQLGVIVAHRVVHGLDDVVRGDDADDTALFAQHRDGGFGVAAQAIQTRLDLLMRQNGREMAADERIQRGILARDDQILEGDGTVKRAVVVADEEGGDVVVLLGLRNQRAHGLLDGQMAVDGDEVRAHRAADFIRLVGADEADVVLRFGIELLHQGAAQFGGDGFQRVNRVVGVHGLDDVGSLLLRQLAEVLARVADIGEDVAQPLDAEQAIQPRALANVEQLERGGDVALVRVVQHDGELLVGLAAGAKQARQLADTGGHGKRFCPFVFHSDPLFLHEFMNLVEHELRAVRVRQGGEALTQQLAIRPKRVDGGRQGFGGQLALRHDVRQTARLERIGVEHLW